MKKFHAPILLALIVLMSVFLSACDNNTGKKGEPINSHPDFSNPLSMLPASDRILMLDDWTSMDCLNITYCISTAIENYYPLAQETEGDYFDYADLQVKLVNATTGNFIAKVYGIEFDNLVSTEQIGKLKGLSIYGQWELNSNDIVKFDFFVYKENSRAHIEYKAGTEGKFKYFINDKELND